MVNTVEAHPKVSVIVPVYNMAPYISQCLDSVISQTLKDIEIICVDDGSTDDSLCIIKKYAEIDNRIIVITQENQGSGPARNNGLSKATGEYIAFMDPDDWYPDYDILETQTTTADEKSVVICGGSIIRWVNNHYIDINEIKIENPAMVFTNDEMIYYQDFQQAAYYTRYIYNRKFLTEQNIRFPNYRRGQDPPFLIDAMIAAGKFFAIKKVTYCYRDVPKNVFHKMQNVIDYLLSVYYWLEISKRYGYSKLHTFSIDSYLMTYISALDAKLDFKNPILLDRINDINKMINIKMYHRNSPILINIMFHIFLLLSFKICNNPIHLRIIFNMINNNLTVKKIVKHIII